MAERVSLEVAATALSRSRNTVLQMIHNGDLVGGSEDRRFWVDAVSLEQVVAERARWVTYLEAAVIVGASSDTVVRLVQIGALVSRRTHGRASILRSSAEQVGVERRSAEEMRSAATEGPPASGPPDRDYVWLDAEVVALMLGQSSHRVRQLARAERLPAVQRGRRWWFRRDLIEATAAARAAAARVTA